MKIYLLSYLLTYLANLETRRLRDDLIQRCLKYLKALLIWILNIFFELNIAPTRGHSLKLVKPRCSLDLRKLSFAHIVVDIWDSLDDRIVECDSIFKIDSTHSCTVEG